MEDMKTSWSDKQLTALCEPKNHKIVYDGYEFWWYHKLEGKKWELHYINGFEDWKKPYSWLQGCLYNWSKELTERKIKSATGYFYQMKQDLEKSKQVIEIAEDNAFTTKRKIELIKELLPDTKVTQMAKLLKISRQAIHKQM